MFSTSRPKQKIVILLIVVSFIGIGWFALVASPDETVYQRVEIGGKGWRVIGVADTPETRARGLSHRETLEPQAGLLFAFPKPGKPSFWMKDMRFPIDIIFIREGVVDSVALDQTPGDLTLVRPKGPVTHVFEVNAGEAEGVYPGEGVRLR